MKANFADNAFVGEFCTRWILDQRRGLSTIMFLARVQLQLVKQREGLATTLTSKGTLAVVIIC